MCLSHNKRARCHSYNMFNIIISLVWFSLFHETSQILTYTGVIMYSDSSCTNVVGLRGTYGHFLLEPYCSQLQNCTFSRGSIPPHYKTHCFGADVPSVPVGWEYALFGYFNQSSMGTSSCSGPPTSFVIWSNVTWDPYFGTRECVPGCTCPTTDCNYGICGAISPTNPTAQLTGIPTEPLTPPTDVPTEAPTCIDTYTPTR
jgi:hypothetical protein